MDRRSPTETSFRPGRDDPFSTTASFVTKGNAGGTDLSAQLLEVLGEILEHMRTNNEQQFEQNALMRKYNQEQKGINTRLGLLASRLGAVAFGVLIGAAVAGTAVYYSVGNAQRVEDTRAKLHEAQKKLDDNAKLADEINKKAESNTKLLRELASDVEDLPVMEVDANGRAVFNVSISEDQARNLKKPRRSPSLSSRAIEVEEQEDTSTQTKKYRAKVPLEMGFH